MAVMLLSSNAFSPYDMSKYVRDLKGGVNL